jgi:hypothetical protein
MTEAGTWEKLPLHSATLIDSRLQLHWAAQALASVGGQHVEPRPDDSHRNIEWVANLSAFVGNLSGGEKGFRLALHPRSLELRLLDADHTKVSSIDLKGKILDEGYLWVEEVISSFTGMGVVTLTRPEYEMPPHGVANGDKFGIPDEDLKVLSDCYANSAIALKALGKKIDNLSPIRCWPHHFDIGGLIVFGGGDDPEKQQSVGLGMTPGDGSYDEPYWYISPWPYPKNGDLPELATGHWHTEGFTAAILTASDIEALSTSGEQEIFVSKFLSEAFSAAKKVALSGQN